MRIGLDQETEVVGEHAAVVYAPRRRRDRFPEGAVTLQPDAAAARARARPEAHRYAARVVGPSRSSEGVRLYYLVEWLD